MNELRRIWLVTHNGVPHRCSWAMVKTQNEEADPVRKSWAAALDPSETSALGYDATPTEWRRVPQMIQSNHGGVVDGTDVVVAGLRYSMTARGRARLNVEHEPDEPDALVEDEDALLDACEAMDRPIRFTERDTLSRWSVRADGVDELDGADVLIRRDGATKARRNRA